MTVGSITDRRGMRIFNYHVEGKEDNKITMVANLSGSLPILIIGDNIIANTKVYDSDKAKVIKSIEINQVLSDPEFLDKEGKERFIGIGDVTSLQTGNMLSFWYDRKYKDIFVIPAFIGLNYSETLSDIVPPVVDVYNVEGFTIGGLENAGRNIMVDEMIANNEANHIPLPETVEGYDKEMKVHTCFIPGVNKSIYYKSMEVIKDIEPGLHVSTGIIDFVHIIDIGLPDELFQDFKTLPKYMIYQMGISKYCLKRYGNSDDKGMVRVALRF